MPVILTVLASIAFGIWAYLRGLPGPVVTLLAIICFFFLTLTGAIVLNMISSRTSTSEISDERQPAGSQQNNRHPRLIVYAHRFFDVVLDPSTGRWRESNPQDAYKLKSLIFQIRNDVHDDKSGVPADGLRAQLTWKYANGNPGPNLSPIPWLDEPLGIINLPVGATARLLVGTKNQNYWDGWANLRTSETAAPSSEHDMLPHHGVLVMRMIGGTNKVWFEAHLKWKLDPTFNHPEFQQITEAESAELIKSV